MSSRQTAYYLLMIAARVDKERLRPSLVNGQRIHAILHSSIVAVLTGLIDNNSTTWRSRSAFGVYVLHALLCLVGSVQRPHVATNSPRIPIPWPRKEQQKVWKASRYRQVQLVVGSLVSQSYIQA